MVEDIYIFSDCVFGPLFASFFKSSCSKVNISETQWTRRHKL